MLSSKPAIIYHWLFPLIIPGALIMWVAGRMPLRYLLLILTFKIGLHVYHNRSLLFKYVSHLPGNLTTSSRLLLILIIPWLHYQFDSVTLTILYLAAALMDGLDGFLARMFDGESEAGADFDEEADAIFLISISIGLIITRDIGWWMLLPAILREFWLIIKPFISSPEIVMRFAFAKWVAGASFALLPFCFILPRNWSIGIAIFVVMALSGSFVREVIILMRA